MGICEDEDDMYYQVKYPCLLTFNPHPLVSPFNLTDLLIRVSGKTTFRSNLRIKKINALKM